LNIRFKVYKFVFIKQLQKFLWKYISIFFLSFLAATIIPFSSKVGLLSYMALGKFNNELLLIFASLGNILGSCVNYTLGLCIINLKTKSWFHLKIINFKGN